MNFLVTGSNGQLGNELKKLSSEFCQHLFIFTDVDELDITNEILVNEFFLRNKFDIIVNCAAYTAVDKAETEHEQAKKVNILAPAYLAKAATAHNCLLIHISTDYVFDGKTHLPYIESDSTNPTSYYGFTKNEGEKEVLKNASRAVIIRTSWLYSLYGNNFVKTISKYAAERGALNVVFDQIGSPTFAGDLARVIVHIAHQYKKNTCEIYHYANEGVASWYDFAVEIMDLMNISCKITAIISKDYPTPAARPHYSVFNKSKIKKEFGIEIPHWRESLKKCLIG